MQKRREPGRRTQDMKVVSMDELKRNRQTRAAGTRAGAPTGGRRGEPTGRRPDAAPRTGAPAGRRKPEREGAPRRAPLPMQENRHRSASHNQKANGRYGLIALFVMLGLLAAGVLLGLQIFQIRSVAFTGAETLDSTALQKQSGIEVGQNIFQVSLNDAKKKLEADPLIEVLRIRRAFPDKITIEVRERKPHAAVSYLATFLIIDEKCIVLDERSDLPTGQYPLISGLEAKPSEKGKRLQGIDSAALDVLDRLLTALYDGGALKFIGQIDMKNAQNIVMRSPEGLRIEIGKPDELLKKAHWIAGTMPELRKSGHTKGTLFVTGANSPVYSTEEVVTAPTGSAQPSASATPGITATPTGEPSASPDETEESPNQQSNEDGDVNA